MVKALPTKSFNIVLNCRRRMWSPIVLQQQNARSEAQGTFSESIYLMAVDLYPMVYGCLARSPAVSSFTHSR
ncbi:hypothetical protein TNCV_2186711 [Trichonephila clavipes]|nr:hypothetical protein TNCV_2186711 [Trichonephila clavipes]